MTKHEVWNRLSAYLDGQLPVAEAGAVEAHVAQCPECQAELEEFKDAKLQMSRVPFREAPSQLINRLRHQFDRPSLLERSRAAFRSCFVVPLIWKPLGAALVLFAVVGFLFLRQGSRPAEEYVDLDTILAAHHRYKAESLVPPADMVQSNYSLRLASYDPNGN